MNKTVRQFAKDLDVHPNTVYGWIKSGTLPCLKLGGIIRIRPCDEAELFVRCEFDARDAANDEEGSSIVPVRPSKDAYEMGAYA